MKTVELLLLRHLLVVSSVLPPAHAAFGMFALQRVLSSSPLPRLEPARLLRGDVADVELLDKSFKSISDYLCVWFASKETGEVDSVAALAQVGLIIQRAVLVVRCRFGQTTDDLAMVVTNHNSDDHCRSLWLQLSQPAPVGATAPPESLLQRDSPVMPVGEGGKRVCVRQREREVGVERKRERETERQIKGGREGERQRKAEKQRECVKEREGESDRQTERERERERDRE
jgi:hypothetical protein